MERISVAGPWITEHEIKTVEDCMRNGWNNYQYVEKFETEFAGYHDRRFGLMTPCCTHAIHLILLSIGIKAGDEVVVPECTWTATAAPITYERAIPVFSDISPEDWCLDPESVERNITKKTRAIIVVDLYGNMPKMDKLTEIAKAHDIFLVEDSAEALGSKYKGIRAGKFGIGSVFSFHRTKTITTGEGGMLLLDDEMIYERAKFLRDHGRSSEIPYYTLEATPKYMPSNLQASLGHAQFQRLEELIRRKRELLRKYKERLSEVEDLQFNVDSDDIQNGAWATSLVIGKSHKMSKPEAIGRLAEMGIPVRPFFYPMSSLPAYEHYGTGSKEKNPNAYDVSERGITLPCDYTLTDEQIDRVCEGIKTILS